MTVTSIFNIVTISIVHCLLSTTTISIVYGFQILTTTNPHHNNGMTSRQTTFVRNHNYGRALVSSSSFSLYSSSTQQQQENITSSSSSNSDDSLSSLLALSLSSTSSDSTTTNSSTSSSCYATLLVYGPDQKGIVAAFAQVLAGHGCSIYDAEQSTDRDAGLFFQRIRFDYCQMYTDQITLVTGIASTCQRFHMNYTLNWNTEPKKIAIFVSKYDHCLWELLLRSRAGELSNGKISMIISNHPDLQPIAAAFNIPYYVFPITKTNKLEQEQEEIKLLQQNNIDVIILARYMQIISPTFCDTFPYKIINIHHSFLPAFIGSRPYHRAYDRGVKLIGATAHYATSHLDEGPIIEQDTIRVTHADDVTVLIRKGRILEKNVLVTAIQAHIEDRILIYNNKCVVFGS